MTPSWLHLVPSWRHPGASRGPAGASWGRLGDLLWPPWAALGTSLEPSWGPGRPETAQDRHKIASWSPSSSKDRSRCCQDGLYCQLHPNLSPNWLSPRATIPRRSSSTAAQEPRNTGRRSIAVGVFNPPPRVFSTGAGRLRLLSRTLKTFLGPPVPAIFPSPAKIVFALFGPKMAQDRLQIA